MRLADKRLQDMTNEFLTRFLAMAHVINQEQYPGKEVPANSHDGYAFNYELAECLAYSDFGVKKAQEHQDFPLIGSGFAANVVKGFFANAVLGIKDDVAFIIENFDKQDDGLDYYVRALKDKTEKKTVTETSMEFILHGIGNKTDEVEHVHRTVSFTIHNAKSGYDGKCTVHYVDGKFKDMEVYGKDGKQVDINRHEEPTITHFKHVADINSFFLMIEQVKYGIEETLEEQ